MRLLGRGDMLYKAADALNLLRLQGCFVADSELGRLVEHWREHSQALPYQLLTPSFPIKPDFPLENNDEEDEQDELLPQAIDLAKNNEAVSTSFWKRFADRLRSCGAAGRYA